jgi:type I restriction enzyme S subunit
LNIDFILGYLHRLLERRSDLKIVISSATLDAEHFSDFFGGAPVISVEGRTFPVEDHYHPPSHDHERMADQIRRAVEWLGDVPAHWEVYALKRFVEMRSGEAIDASAIRDEGVVPVYGGNGTRGFTDQATHEGEYVLVGRQGALCGNVNYANGPFWASEHAVVVTPKQSVAVRWLGEMLRAMNLNQYSVSAAQPGLAVSAIVELRTALPPLSEQRAIVAFLDRETAKIDTLVAQAESAISLLTERRSALISAAVTGQIDVRNAVPSANPTEAA